MLRRFRRKRMPAAMPGSLKGQKVKRGKNGAKKNGSGKGPGPTGWGKQKREKHNNWQRYRLPEDMTGKSFLDIGCWEGVNCVEAVRRGAEHVVGVDLCTSEALARNVEEHGFEFVQLDIFSEKWLELDDFDVVLCGGVLYHVENPISMLFRLRRVTRELLVLETATRGEDIDEPVMVFRPTDETGNPSNWWMPNRACLTEMLKACGFTDVEGVWEKVKTEQRGRWCVHARPVRQQSYERVLPRKAELMPLAGGSRDSG